MWDISNARENWNKLEKWFECSFFEWTDILFEMEHLNLRFSIKYVRGNAIRY